MKNCPIPMRKKLRMQLEDMAKRNAEQQKTIRQLMTQITDLTAQIQTLVNTGMQGGASSNQHGTGSADDLP